MLFSVLTGCTLGHLVDPACCLMKMTLVVGAREGSSAQQELNLFEAHVAKSVVPSEKLLLGLGEVEIAVIDCRNRSVKAFGSFGSVTFTMSVGGRKVVVRIDMSHNHCSSWIT